MPKGEALPSSTKVVFGTAGAAAILIAAVLGLALGDAATPDQADPDATWKEASVAGREAALEEVRTDTEETGIADGTKAGVRQGRKAGRRAGLSDGKTKVALDQTDLAESTAASAQSELSTIAAPPPLPPGQ